MTLTLQEACARAGLTPRQMRYRIKEGEVKARKVEGRWVIDEDAIPVDTARARRTVARAAELRQTVDEAIARQVRGIPRYSVEDVRVFRDLVTLRRSLTLEAARGIVTDVLPGLSGLIRRQQAKRT